MSRDQRLNDNHALLITQEQAIKLKLPIVIIFNFHVSSHRSREHYQFMIDGLSQLVDSAREMNISVLFFTDSVTELANHIKKLDPAAVYFDFSPLDGPTKVRRTIADALNVSCYEVDTHNVIPAWVASDHQEFAAHTFRSKVHKNLANYLAEPPKLIKHPFTFTTKTQGINLDEVSKQVMPKIEPCGINVAATSGESAAHAHLKQFISSKLKTFALQRNDPSQDGLSGLSPYLHFGQISSLRVALEVLKNSSSEPLLFNESRLANTGDQPSLTDGMNALFEEMIVRKELSDNFCLYTKSYRDPSGAPAWAQTTLKEHAADTREFIYSRDQWEVSATHDPAWNAAQNQLRSTGKIHGYMRMYWAKKMLEWSVSLEAALADCIYLNDKYSIDGGDPNGYVGILWSIAGLHDRPWTERPVFGKVRYMNYAGLKRKFKIESYIERWTNQTTLI
jgi:deoxyribodipyrimidine photo-lyase